jgi:NAD+ diphosphatase
MTASFCLQCGAALVDRENAGRLRRVCPVAGCGYVHYDNPLPVVAALVELPEGVVLARSKEWPEGMFGLITGFLESGEEPHEAALREVREELGLSPVLDDFIGVYSFPQQNQVILAWHVRAEGKPKVGDELAAIKIVPVEKLRSWSVGTGLAVRDWLSTRLRPDPADTGGLD